MVGCCFDVHARSAEERLVCGGGANTSSARGRVVGLVFVGLTCVDLAFLDFDLGGSLFLLLVLLLLVLILLILILLVVLLLRRRRRRNND